MSTVRQLWDVASFRGAVRHLVALGGDDLRLVHRVATDREAVLDDGEEENLARIAPALSALSTLISIATEVSPDEVVDDLRELAAIGEDSIERLRPLLQPRDVDVEASRISRAQTAGLPVLERVSLEVDFRAAKAAALSDSRILVPIIIARLEMDEPISGSDAVVFQIPVSDISRIVGRLMEAQSRVQEYAELLPDGLVRGPSAAG